ncbi:PDZ domain-containing protein [Alkalihalobacillus pseudalcaliphilus]|uniref:PDZ domain-containing protein n=1 Tax=Alkalihalobacillus pseudalcaliphilus TaxID=79884 RepID=UPI000AF39763|nr:PDZ domain-containing protein [Alkalihalobacillus pseudalcaliphilus]
MMVMDILKTVGIAFGYFFANPLLYVGLIIILVVANYRIKIERQSFHTRVYSRKADFLLPFWPSLLAGICISIVAFGLGVVVNIPILILMVGLYALAILTTNFRWVSPVTILGFTTVILMVGPLIQGQNSFSDLFQSIADTSISALFTLLLVFLIAEAFLIIKNGSKHTSPRLVKSKRGKWIGVHKQKRLWIVPVVLFIPEGLLPTFEFWPVFTTGELSLQPVFVPFLVGFQHIVKSALPEWAIKRIGKKLLILALLAIPFAVVGYFYPIVAVVAAVIIFALREWMMLSEKNNEEKLSKYFTELKEGCKILGVLPNSPADKMELKVGETIAKVNGRMVQNQDEFYHALQVNSAFCKLEVLDYAGEVRFAQGAIYVGEHHQLGVLLVKTEQALQNSVI